MSKTQWNVSESLQHTKTNNSQTGMGYGLVTSNSGSSVQKKLFFRATNERFCKSQCEPMLYIRSFYILFEVVFGSVDWLSNHDNVCVRGRQ